jgi:hypothetical protein
MTDNEFRDALQTLMVDYIGTSPSYERINSLTGSMIGAALWSINGVDIQLGAGAPSDDVVEAQRAIMRGLVVMMVSQCPVTDGVVLCEMYEGISYLFARKYLSQTMGGDIALGASIAGLCCLAAQLTALDLDFEGDEARVEHYGITLGEAISKLVADHYVKENPETGMMN